MRDVSGAVRFRVAAIVVAVMMIQMTTNRTDIRATFPTLVYQAFADGAR